MIIHKFRINFMMAAVGRPGKQAGWPDGTAPVEPGGSSGTGARQQGSAGRTSTGRRRRDREHGGRAEGGWRIHAKGAFVRCGRWCSVGRAVVMEAKRCRAFYRSAERGEGTSGHAVTGDTVCRGSPAACRETDADIRRCDPDAVRDPLGRNRLTWNVRRAIIALLISNAK